MSEASAGGLDARTACALLAGVGIPLAPEAVRAERRDDRRAVALPGDRMAWFRSSRSGDAGLGDAGLAQFRPACEQGGGRARACR